MKKLFILSVLLVSLSISAKEFSYNCKTINSTRVDLIISFSVHPNIEIDWAAWSEIFETRSKGDPAYLHGGQFEDVQSTALFTNKDIKFLYSAYRQTPTLELRVLKSNYSLIRSGAKKIEGEAFVENADGIAFSRPQKIICELESY